MSSRRKPRLAKKKAARKHAARRAAHQRGRAPLSGTSASTGLTAVVAKAPEGAGETLAELIARLGLQPHPEGGWFRETFRSRSIVVTRYPDGAMRSGLTTILFLLAADAVSRWHRVASDESWHFHRGAPLELLTLDPESGQLEIRRLDAHQPVLTVPARVWQAARTCGAFTLVSCSVGPGFDFEDFTLLSSVPLDERPKPADPLQEDLFRHVT
jgi:uncharacterized protein